MHRESSIEDKGIDKETTNQTLVIICLKNNTPAQTILVPTKLHAGRNANRDNSRPSHLITPSDLKQTISNKSHTKNVKSLYYAETGVEVISDSDVEEIRMRGREQRQPWHLVVGIGNSMRT